MVFIRTYSMCHGFPPSLCSIALPRLAYSSVNSFTELRFVMSVVFMVSGGGFCSGAKDIPVIPIVLSTP